MSKRQKLKDKLLEGTHDKNFRFDELCGLMEALGFTASQTGGSHRIFRKEGIEELINLQRDSDGKAKAYQVRQVRKIVGAYKL
jgi:hypothetical protein